MRPYLWYRDKDSLNLGGVCRYTITYTLIDPNKKEIYYRLKNIERASIRAIHLLNGPFILYCHVIPHNYDHLKEFNPSDSEDNKEVIFENEIKPGQTFNVKLKLNENSYVKDSEDGYPIYLWSIDVISQIIITTKTVIMYDFMIGDDFKAMKRINHGPFPSSLTSVGNKDFSYRDSEATLGVSVNPKLNVKKQNTKDLWTNEPKYPEMPVHLIILTHGIFSNVTADMLHLKDSLESSVTENILVRGYEGNAGKSEKGIKKLGIRLSKYVTHLIEDLNDSGIQIAKISFIGHSLGGLVQLYAIKEILLTRGEDYFMNKNIKPQNLICMASPLLGILSEMNILISWFLDLGTLGKTGRDLTLLKKIPNFKQLANKHDMHKRDTFKPLLEMLPDDPLQDFLSKFENLTLYANAINDGIVPLRTSGLLYLDYEALGDVGRLQHDKNKKLESYDHDDTRLIETNTTKESVGEIPADKTEKSDSTKQKRNKNETYRQLLSLNLSTNRHNKHLVKKGPNRKQRNILRINAKGSDLVDYNSETDDSVAASLNNETSFKSGVRRANDTLQSESDERVELNLPPKASSLESALSTMFCPTPSSNYILKPGSRNPVIFHDKYYHFEGLPIGPEQEHERSKSSRLGKVLFNYNEWKLDKQVKIAKKYHTPKLNWRKILVNLPPDAHNNIIVRRKFSNGYGWGVIDHLCKELFDTDIQHLDNVGSIDPKMKAKI
ncbi:uncharacterized protein AC631_01387 [Debaryomyces fabryi]|uniref:DUF676 domain-containing protein n=1 Tax=Debaryomyces fabryi TaxID=58627 RepID=A0A0V1Q2Z4_9ASCO|nr:uncharacterized protein AC631_01387 [Debaryomyces fabryi]KSA02907.1 hypothetical protein AC631_01387 [Debaryomyces fabryi]CUM45018.1 unnamed protein product [Debaryomyces fabryi]